MSTGELVDAAREPGSSAGGGRSLRQPLIAAVNPLRNGFSNMEKKVHGALVRHSIAALQVSVGAVFLTFGALKFFPGVSPAEDRVVETIDVVTFGLVPSRVGVVATAVLECFIGICLLADRCMRLRSGCWPCSSPGCWLRSCC
ncbi:MAG: hypothetical protein M3N32_08265 [Actinomycetota bacterium]|nr:hypothetical protein [Actinomycetota bacterium]